MANTPELKTGSSAAADRVLQALVTYLRRRNYTRDSYPHDDKILQNKTLKLINDAFDILEKPPASALDAYYLKLMDGGEEYSTTPGARVHSPDWIPLKDLRWEPIKCTDILHGSTMLIFTPVDVFTIMWCRVELERTIRIFYGLQSLLAKETTKYYLAYTANPTARKPSWRLRALGSHEIAKGLPIRLGTTSSFSSKNRIAFEKLNPLPPLQSISPEQAPIHDFIVQIITGGANRDRFGSTKYEGRKFAEINLREDPAPPVMRDTKQGGQKKSLSAALLERQQTQARLSSLNLAQELPSPALPTALQMLDRLTRLAQADPPL